MGKIATLLVACVLPLVSGHQSSAQTLSNGTKSRFLERAVFSLHGKPGVLPTSNYDVPKSKLDDCINRVWLKVNRGDVAFRQGESVSSLASRLKDAADAAIVEVVSRPSVLLRQRCYAEVVCAWTCSYCYYDNALSDSPFEQQKAKSRTDYILGLQWPMAICSGKALVVRDLSRLVGKSVDLHCYYVGGWRRELGQKPTSQSNHSWNLFEFEDGTRLPADVTAAGITREEAIMRTGKFNRKWILPETSDECELFLARSFGYAKFDDDIYSHFDETRVPDTLQNRTFTEWAGEPTSQLAVIDHR